MTDGNEQIEQNKVEQVFKVTSVFDETKQPVYDVEIKVFVLKSGQKMLTLPINSGFEKGDQVRVTLVHKALERLPIGRIRKVLVSPPPKKEDVKSYGFTDVEQLMEKKEL